MPTSQEVGRLENEVAGMENPSADTLKSQQKANEKPKANELITHHLWKFIDGTI